MRQETHGTAPARRRAHAVRRGRSDSDAAAARGLGWYLYGIVRNSHSREAELVDAVGLDGRRSVEALPCGDLVAVVSRVDVAEFGAEALRAPLRDAAWLETVVRGHDRVVRAVHQQRAVLPAKFGCVFATARDLAAALEQTHDLLLAQMRRVEGCDEWGVRLRADWPTIRELVAAENPAVQRIRQDLVSARPGRAFFLQRKLTETLAAETAQAAADLARAAYDRLAGCAVSGRVNAELRLSRDVDAEVDILRAAFLVRVAQVDAFLDEIRRFVEGHAGLRSEYSGPWPPYSFAALEEGVPR